MLQKDMTTSGSVYGKARLLEGADDFLSPDPGKDDRRERGAQGDAHTGTVGARRKAERDSSLRGRPFAGANGEKKSACCFRNDGGWERIGEEKGDASSHDPS